MFATFLVMATIELSLLIDKPNARYFAFTILAVGLVLRGLVQERRARKENGAVPADTTPLPVATLSSDAANVFSRNGDAMLCAVRSKGRTLDFALREARETGRQAVPPLVREQRFMTEEDRKRKWPQDAEAREIFETAKQQTGDHSPLFCYAVSESAAETIVDLAATLGASRLILGAPQAPWSRPSPPRKCNPRSLRPIAGRDRPPPGLRVTKARSSAVGLLDDCRPNECNNIAARSRKTTYTARKDDSASSRLERSPQGHHRHAAPAAAPGRAALSQLSSSQFATVF